MPVAYDVQHTAVLVGGHNAVVGGSHDKAVGESDVVDVHIGAVGAQIVGLLDFLACQVHHHYAEPAGKIGAAVVEANTVNLLVAADVDALDVADVEHLVFLYQVQVGVVVGHNQILCLLVVGKSADAHIVQNVGLVHPVHRIVTQVVVEQSACPRAVYAVAGLHNGKQLVVRQVVAPFAYSQLCVQRGKAGGKEDGHYG